MQAIEVVARFETTVLATVDLRPGGAYRIGTARDVDLPVEGEECFAIVEGDRVRIPRRATATVFEAGRAPASLTGESTLGRRSRVELRIGRVSIAIRWITLPDPLARPELDRRTPIYIAASLALHLAVVAIAVELAPFEEPAPPPRPVRVARVGQSPPDKATLPTPVPAVSASATDPTTAPPPAATTPETSASRRRRAISRAKEAGILGADGIDDLRGLSPGKLDKAFNGVRPVYREEEAVTRSFGGGQSWDQGGIIKVGRYSTNDDDGYELGGATPAKQVVVEVCDGRPCELTGPHDRDAVIQYVQARSKQLVKCHRKAATDELVTLEFDIDRDGAVLRPTAAGSDIADCVLAVVKRIDFPIAPGDEQTTVKLSIGFAEK